MFRFAVMAVFSGGLSACDDVPDSRPQERASREISVASEELNRLARESGALPDSERQSPMGHYGKRYDGGSDALCLLPEDEEGGGLRFVVESRMGRGDYCLGTGRANLSNDKLVLRFEGAAKDCRIVARYEGDAIMMPSATDPRCAALCSGRGSIAGVRFPRLGYLEAAKMTQTGAEKAQCR